MTVFRRNVASLYPIAMICALGLMSNPGRADEKVEAPASIHVATDGNDEWSGTLATPNAERTDGPFATLARARDAVRRLRADAQPREPVVVRVHAGRYELAEPLIFTPEDSGTPQSPTIYTAAPGDEGKTVISGGKVVTNWKAERGPRGEQVAELPGLKDGWRFRHVSVNGQWRGRPRLPEGATAAYTMAGLAGIDGNVPYNTPSDRFEYAPGQIDPHWTALSDVEVVVLHFWIDSHLKIAQVEPDRRIVKLDRTSRMKFTDEHQATPGRYYVSNVYEALSPGQFYANTGAGTLHFMPLKDESADRSEFIAPRLASLVEFRGDPKSGRFVEYVTLRGITFSDTSWEPGPREAMEAQASRPGPGSCHRNRGAACRDRTLRVEEPRRLCDRFARRLPGRSYRGQRGVVDRGGGNQD